MYRQVMINYVDGVWMLGLIENQVVKVTRAVPVYHDIGRIASNWILHGDPNG